MNQAAALLEEWHAHLAQGRRRSPHTVRAYGAAAARLLHAHDITDWPTLASLDAKALRAHLAARRAEGLSNASTARELSAIKALMRFACTQAGLPETAVPRLRGPRLKKGLPRPVTPDDIDQMTAHVADAPEAAWIGSRDRAVLLLMYGAGLRIAEAISLKGAQADPGETLLVTGKGGKQRVVPILPIVRKAIADYVARCPHPLPADEALFRGARGGPLSQGMVQQAVARARATIGLPASATPHALRHSFASHLLSEGADLRSLQELLGHASLASTQIYTKVDSAMLLATYRRAHPRERE